MSYFLAFLASLAYIFLKATQQLQVVNFRYARILPVSMGLAFTEVFILVNVIQTAHDTTGLVILATCIGLGAGIGCLLAMRTFSKTVQ